MNLLYYFFAQKSRSIAIPYTLRFDFLRGLALACFLLIAGIVQSQDITLTVDAPNDPVDCGATVTFLIKADGFNDIVSGLQYSVNWDPSKLAYQSHDINPGDVFTPGGELPEANVDQALGQLGFLWVDTEVPYNTSIADGSAILSITFIVRAIGELGVELTDIPTEILAQDYDFEDLIVATDATDLLTVENPCVINLTVDAPPVDPMDPIVCGDIVTYNILVDGFYGYVSTLQFPILWNTAELEYVSSTYNPAVYTPGVDLPVIGLQDANVLVYTWGDGLVPFEVSIPDNTVIMSVSFQVKSIGPLPIDISETYPDPNGPFLLAQDLNFTNIDVVIDDADAVENTTVCEIDLLVDAPTNASCGDTITVNILADGMYSNVNTLQFSVNWDSIQLEYVSSSFAPAVYAPTSDEPLLTHPATLMPPTGPDGAVTYIWGDNGPPYGVPLADGTVIMTLQLKVISDGTFNINITGDPTLIDATDNINFDIIPVNVTGDAVVVVDTIAPVISGCPTNIALGTDTGVCDAVATWTPPTATDNCTVSLTPTGSHASGDVFPSGTTTVSYNVSDAAGNPAITCSFTVTVTEDEAPVIVDCPTNIALGTDAGVCNAVATWTAPTATDNCDVSLTPTGSHASGDVFPSGTTTVSYNVSDAAGNAATTCSFTVTVTDDEAPVISG